MNLLKSPITVGIVGLGRAGWQLHLVPITKHSGFKVVAVADPLAERCEEAFEQTGCEKFSSLDELLKHSDAQLIVIATPSSTHYQDVRKVLKAGRHCIAEKPLALQTSEANELVALAKKSGLHLFINHTHLHLPYCHHFNEVLKSNVLGKLFSIRVCWSYFARRWDWQTLRKNGGGALNNTCPHVLSVVLPWLDGPVEEVFADLRNIKDAGDAEDHVHMVLRTASGMTADIVVSSAMALPVPRWMFLGNQGSMSSDGTTCTLRYFNGTKVPSLSVLDTAAPDRQYLTEELPWEERTDQIAESASPLFHENVFDVLTKGVMPIVTPESAAEVVRVTNLVHAEADRFSAHL